MFTLKKIRILTLILSLVLVGAWLYSFKAQELGLLRGPQSLSLGEEVITRNKLVDLMGPVFERNEWLEKVKGFDQEELYSVQYSLSAELQSFTKNIVKRYRPDYCDVVVLDARTGRILVLLSTEVGEPSPVNRVIKATFPAASIFKMVTAAAAIEKYNLTPEVEISYTGSNYTLYKRNLFNKTPNRWARTLSMTEAFAKSINIYFGKLAIEFMHPLDLVDYANRFLFNQKIQTDLPVEISKAGLIDQDPYHVAEIASGYNDVNTLSPLHGALMASAVVNDGVVYAPYIVDALFDESGQEIYRAQSEVVAQPILFHTAQKLRELMMATVQSGTSRKSFRQLNKSLRFQELEVGGKTGSLTGSEPKGKTDWFVGYAEKGEDRLAIAVVTVNKEFWRVKSAFLAQEIIKQHFK